MHMPTRISFARQHFLHFSIIFVTVIAIATSVINLEHKISSDLLWQYTIVNAEMNDFFCNRTSSTYLLSSICWRMSYTCNEHFKRLF